jgi:hypothetical protein
VPKLAWERLSEPVPRGHPRYPIHRAFEAALISRVRSGRWPPEAEDMQHVMEHTAHHADPTVPLYGLTGAIDRLEEVDDGHDVQAVVQLSAELVDTRAQKTVWRHSESTREPVSTRDVAAVVGSLSAATQRAIDALIASLESDVARR